MAPKIEPITKSEFARRIGITPAAVTKLIKRGQISTTIDGLIDWKSGREQYTNNLDPARRKVNFGATDTAKKVKKPKLPNIDAETLTDIKKLLASEGIDVSTGLTFELIRAAESLARAHERMFKLSIQRREYVKLRDVQETGFRIVVGFRKAMEGIPAGHADIIAAKLGCNPHALEQEMLRVIKETLNSLAPTVGPQ